MKPPKKEEIIAAYGKADEKGKELLKWLFPDVEFEQKPITERIKTFEDACRELGEYNPLVASYRQWIRNVDYFDLNLEAYLKLRIIIEALNERWDVRKQKECSYWRVVFRNGRYTYEYSGLASTGAYFDASSAYSIVGSRLVFKSEELADYCAQQFADLWKYYFIR